MTLPKLNLRDLFWFVVVVAMGLGWWLDRSKLDDRARRADVFEADIRKAILEAGGDLDIQDGKPRILTMSSDGILRRP